MHDDEKIAEAILTLLESNVGYGIEFFGLMLSVRQLDDLTFAVSHEKFNPEIKDFEFDFEKLFENAREATEFFLKLRREYQLGYDFEREPQ